MATKSSRRRAREYAMQGVYQWLLAGGVAHDIDVQLRADKHFDQADPVFFARLLTGTLESIESLEPMIAPHLDRPLKELTPVERAILLIGAFELRECVDVPYRVIVNEAIELTKTFGGTDGHRYVNGVLDKLVGDLRPAEARA
ncbi:MAG: transcription antitermination factor NusB [Burkholderiales bacterium]